MMARWVCVRPQPAWGLGGFGKVERWEGQGAKVLAGRGSLGVGLPKHPYYRDDERVEDVFSSPTWKPV
jgi:hypothetical protein